MGNNVKGARAKLYGKTDKRTRRVSSQPSIPPQDQVNLTTLLCNIHDQIWGGSYKMFKLTHLKVSILNYQVPLRKKKRKKDLCEMIFGLTLKNNMLICPSTSLFLFMYLVMYIFIRWTLPSFLFFFLIKKGGWLNNGVWWLDI